MLKFKINGQPHEAEPGTTILKAAKSLQINIPTLCYHPDIEPWAACGLCVVKVENSPKMVRSCTTAVVEGQNYITHDPELMEVRKTVIELMQSNHPNECLICARNGSCEFQDISEDFCIREAPFTRQLKDLPKDDSTPSIVLDPRKCINCGRCALVCQQLQDVWALEFINRGYDTVIQPAGGVLLNESPCIKCGQCSAHCPVGAIYEKDETDKFLSAVRDETKHVAVQVAPAIRVAIGEAFGLEPGTLMSQQIYTALRMLGADAVFNTNFAADLTIMEESLEFVNRLTRGDNLPQITSCCPAWTDYMEKYFDDMIPHFSTAKSPMMMQGAVTKTYYAKRVKLAPKNIYSVAIMPCTTKKYEINRDDNMHASGYNDVDLVLTTRELARLIKRAGIDFLNIKDGIVDSPIGDYSGAGTIFGVTGGVMEAALRTAHHLITGKNLDNVNIQAVRGMEGVRVGEILLGDAKLKVAVAHGMSKVRQIMSEVRLARMEGRESPYHFIEVMACKGGCIGGGGQPYNTDEEVRQKRITGIYSDDEKSVVRCSHQNPDIIRIYKDFLGEPLSRRSYDLLHTRYQPRPLYQK
ncbi:Periplasmic [FeFe] hydrogenase large subunit [Olavius algarvensis spirochete endosymbiont]|uniref:NADH-dependent [FeFe] hydrogenase, group A6 n=1 Tax=Olavius algarvensis spirochete endosymbiont TaxID=260710 RepID=UPI00052BE7FB|nr:NADH-dependent [FeFe] hydrogenase, group A6 [Olavius algarvensis spirochete endosymbiont]KGM38388.1 ferredoxin [Alkalispirochaeta odontotermitis]VDB00158.1 Periplasmic [FeFe] hydrogenase large subunit [Olavius algarvensis spirochete endosymbiont]